LINKIYIFQLGFWNIKGYQVGGGSFCTNTIVVIVKFLYDHIPTQFGYPLTIVTNQGTHFINNVICYLTNHFILKHASFIVYYP